jgi:hypothetical protein
VHRHPKNANGPHVWNSPILAPLPRLAVIVFIGASENSMRAVPYLRRQRVSPKGLRLRAIHDEISEALKFSPRTAIEKAIVWKTAGGQDAKAAVAQASTTIGNCCCGFGHRHPLALNRAGR